MRYRYLAVVFLLLFACYTADAVPARRDAFKYTQPDGSVIKLQLHGDEFLSWTTIAGSNQVVDLDKDGFWRPSSISASMVEHGSRMRERMSRRSAVRRQGARMDYSRTTGEWHIPVILIAFQDKDFTISSPAAQFDAMLNQKGYAENGGTGSVQDYFVDNSNGRLRPVFDVYGPVTVPHEEAWYGTPTYDDNGKKLTDDSEAGRALFDACVILDNSVDFSVYDKDKDGFVDMVIFYYAGYSEAEGAAKETIWSHMYSIQSLSDPAYRNTAFDGKRLADYSCMSELRGRSGERMCGIGTTCHEFSHALGLPDFYDTNYQTNGTCNPMSVFSIMDMGVYNNDGCTPPYMTCVERALLGWMPEESVQHLGTGQVSLTSVKNDVAYRSDTDIDGEYFMYECRDGSGWDTYIPQGLVVYHVDKSRVREVGYGSPYSLWLGSDNKINAYGNHPCCRIVPAADQDNLNYQGYTDGWPFPGKEGIHSYSPVDWDGFGTGVELTDISNTGGRVTFNVSVSNTKSIRGIIKDAYGKPVEGVHIVAVPVAPQAASVIRYLEGEQESYEAYSNEKGGFSIDLEGIESTSLHVTATKEGYSTQEADVTFEQRWPYVEFVMTRIGLVELQYYNDDAQKSITGQPGWNSHMAAIRIPKEDLPSDGGRIISVTFTPIWPADAYYIIADCDGRRLLTYEVPGPIVAKERVEDLSGEQAYFPGGKDVFVGYAVKKASIASSGYQGRLFWTAEGAGNFYHSDWSLTASDWILEEEYKDLVLRISVSVVAAAQGSTPASFADMGIACIADPGNGSYNQGDAFPLALELPKDANPSSTLWYFDGQEISASDSVTLPAGRHMVTAVVKYADGGEEKMDLLLDVK
ncbi:MAG: M6 family metalloprotease domain-containing protein [Bacteroidales bacterium]|nr:M6 family metalloprotease domain-containing protein [Bacteroidales bacterium]